MLKIYYQLPNGKSFAHVSRSCTSTLCALALKTFYKDRFIEWQSIANRPQENLDEHWTRKLPSECLVMVRDPLERLASYQSNRNHDWDCIYQIIKAQKRGGVINRSCSEEMSMRRYHHIAPFTTIAEHDSHFILFPEVKKACEYLELEYDQNTWVSKSKKYYSKDISNKIQRLLEDDIIIHKSLTL